MTYTLSKKTSLILLSVWLLLLTSAYIVVAQDTDSDEPLVTIEVTVEPFEVIFGPGSFNLMSTSSGLSNLSNYQAKLILSFDGTNKGQPDQWSHTYTMLVRQIPAARQLTIEKSGQVSEQVYMAEVEGTFYQRQGEANCVSSPIELEGAFAEMWEPVEFIDSVIGADEAGREMINDMVTNHYTFDERALGAPEISESSGEMWIALDGDYLVRFALVTSGDESYFGEGIEGTLTWDYQLTDINQPLEIQLPRDCPPGLLDVPLPPDASNVVRAPGIASFNTSAAVEDVLVFYQELAAASGGQATSQPAVAASSAIFGFTQEDQSLMVIISSETDPTRVIIFQLDDPALLAIADAVPDTSGTESSTQTPSGECVAEAGTMLMLPDASQVQTMSGVLSYMTATSVEDAVAFYEEQIATFGGQVTSPMPTSNMMAMLNATQGGQVFSITIIAMGNTTNVTITSASMNPLSPAAHCNSAQSQATMPQSATTSQNTPAICSVSSASGANQRSGPGTSFAQVGSLASGDHAAVDGQSVGSDGQIWWRLGEGVWVRSDVVNETGNCDSVAVVPP